MAVNLPADLPTDFAWDETIAPNGSDIGQPAQRGYNYLTAQVNAAQVACNQIDTRADKADNELSIAQQLADRIYPGTNLTVKFAAEIAASPYYGNVWAWVHARIVASYYSGIHICDYIPWVSTDGYNVISEIAGIDTYYNYGDAAVPHHIDFISRDLWPVSFAFNRVNYNNGTSVSPYPSLACELFAWLNSLIMDVPFTATADPTLTTVGYSTTGVYDKLPDALKAVIVQKRVLMPQRYIRIPQGRSVKEESCYRL